MLDAAVSNKNTSNTCCVVSSSSDPFLSSSETGVTTTNTSTQKRKRRPAGTPPDAEVVSLSPRTLLESDRYICEICNQGFQRDQNLQMHRRRHKVPWKLLKRDNNIEVKKRVYVCPEPTCLHHDPCHALGDLVGIKKHFRRKHSNHKQWVCERCSKGYAVQSDYKAHLKTCGTRGHSCDCGRVFSVESFIEHQDNCSVRKVHREPPPPPQPTVTVPACSSRTASTASTPSSETNYGGTVAVATPLPLEGRPIHMTNPPSILTHSSNNLNLELELLPLRPNQNPNQENQQQKVKEPSHHHNHHDTTNLNLSIAPSSSSFHHYNNFDRIKEIMASEQIMKIAMKEKAYAEEAKREAKRQREMAENEFVNAKKIRQQAQAELERAKLLKEQSMKKISSTIMQVTCQTCKGQFQAVAVSAAAADETSLVVSYMSSANTDGEAS
uniref:SGR5/ATIDD15 n=1 Tax=Schrenkiella parvula TaxID=98039 RepID=E5F700_9BRAS|nr:SGR5/ATIDD15 [Schrenkiella parvula]